MLNKNNTKGFWVYLPNQAGLYYYKRQSGETLAASVYLNTTRKRNTTQNDLVGSNLVLQVNMTTFSIWDRGEGVTPQEEDVLEEVAGTRWVIKYRTTKIFGNLFSCVCVQEVTAT